MPNLPLRRIARNSRRLNLVLFGVLPLLLIMAGALLWGFQRIISQEQERISIDFTLQTRYMDEQQVLLTRLQQAHILDYSDSQQNSPTIFHAMDDQQIPGATLYQGTPSPVDTPFTLVCQELASCPLHSSRAAGFGRYLADLYSSFWVRSSFPASGLLVVDAEPGASYTVPTVGSRRPNLSAPLTQAAMAAIRADAASADRIRWIGLQGYPDHVLAYLPLRHTASGSPGSYAATLISRERINIFSRVLQRGVYDAHWLVSREDGLLLGPAPYPSGVGPGVNYRADGLVFRIDAANEAWTGYYILSYPSLFFGHYWLLASIIALLSLSPLAGWAYVRRYNRRVIAPAQQAHRQLMESDQFSRTLLETTPVALCVFSRDERRIVFANSLAFKWFDTQVGQSLHDSGLEQPLLERLSRATQPGTIENHRAHDGRSFYIAFAPTRYHDQDVVVCAFADLSARAQMEQELTQAKHAADRANGAKSVFLATMSHEIRTPLYGVLGSLELMGLTDLDAEQRQLLERIQVSSGLLLQIISDILDITRIESGQLALGGQSFDPRELVQGCTGAFIDSARNKDLLLFSCVDPQLPEALLGDPVRIRQILTNLISNAIKFTLSGHVIVRARAEPGRDGQVLMTLQVVDTGIGIGQEEQQQLFTPFYQIDAHSHTVHGAGLGLSICAKLAAMMGSEIRLTSELGLGSSFSMSLELPLAGTSTAPRQPELAGARIYVHSPHHELTGNLCQWLNRWGAEATPLEGAALDGTGPGIVLRVFDAPGGRAEALVGLTEIVLDGQRTGPGASLADACDFSAIGFLLERKLRGEPEPGPTGRAPGLQPLNSLPPLRLNVLVAEDNPINQATLSHQLKQLGCHSTLAADGAEALDLWRIGDYDLLLTDVNMPRMNGYELTTRIRASGDDRPVIGVTANAMCEEEARCRACGMDAWLVKPVQLQTLWASLSQLSGLDTEQCIPLFEEPPSLPSDLRQIFISTMTVDIQTLRQALDEQDYDRIFELLHRVRGSLAVAGYEALIEQLEHFGNDLREAGLTPSTHAHSLTLLHALERISLPD